MTDNESPLHPSASLLCKLGSIARHVEEAHGPGGNALDLSAAYAVAEDPEVADWMAAMDDMALLPVARNAR